MQAALNIFGHVFQLFRPRLVHCQCRSEPGFAGFIAGKQRDEVFLRHFALFNAHLHDDTFLGAHAIHHHTHAVHQVVELLRHQTELLEHFRQLQDLFLSGFVAAAFRFNYYACGFVLDAQLAEFLTGQFRIDGVVIVAAVVVFVFIFVVIVFQLFAGQLRTHMGRGRCEIFFSVRIDKASDQVRKACFARFNAIILFQQIGNGFRVFGNGALNLIDPVFDAFSDVNFAFAGQQFNGTHFTHVHTNRVGGAPDFRLYAGQNLSCSFLCIFISVV